MYRITQRLLFALTLASIATQAHAVEVSLQLVSATYRDCVVTGGPPHGDPEVTCVDRNAVLMPAVPQGHGSVIDIDAAGITIRAVLNLEGFSLDGVPVGPWSLPFAIDPGQYPTFDPGLLALPGSYADGQWLVNLTRMRDQSDFAGTFVLAFDPWRLTFAFTSIPTSAPPPCEGEVLYLDDDGDGEVNSRDLHAHAVVDLFGDAVDAEGSTPWEFCDTWGSNEGRASSACARLDFRNDEPLRKRSGDCQVVGEGRSRSCSPTEFAFRSEPPAVPARTCLGYVVVDDADHDGEPDATDLCANTPSGSLIDGAGCSAPQFCALQDPLSCRRADFLNDEPFQKKPGDCARTRSKPRACEAAH